MQAIADDAGVAIQTVYAGFGTKRELLRQLIERTITGDEEMIASARMLAGPDGLRVREPEAAATLYVLYSPAVADMLMGDHGWSPKRYERWLARISSRPSSADTGRERPLGGRPVCSRWS